LVVSSAAWLLDSAARVPTSVTRRLRSKVSWASPAIVMALAPMLCLRDEAGQVCAAQLGCLDGVTASAGGLFDDHGRTVGVEN